jgi:hypothetical protein
MRFRGGEFDRYNEEFSTGIDRGKVETCLPIVSRPPWTHAVPCTRTVLNLSYRPLESFRHHNLSWASSPGEPVLCL